MDKFNERQKLILSSTVNERCSVGISTDMPVQLTNIQERNKKKLAKLEVQLKEMLDKISTEKYRRKAKPHTKQKDLIQVCINYKYSNHRFMIIMKKKCQCLLSDP